MNDDNSRRPLSIGALMLWLFLVSIFVYLWPSFKFGEPIWDLYLQQRSIHLVVALIPLVVGAFLVFHWSGSKFRNYVSIILANGTLFGLVALVLYITTMHVSRLVLVFTFGLSVVIQVFGYTVVAFLPKVWSRRLLITAIGGNAILILLVGLNPADILGKTFRLIDGKKLSLQSNLASVSEPTHESRYINTAFYDLNADVYRGYLEYPPIRGGGMTRLNEGVLLVTGTGKFYLVNHDSNINDLQVEELAITVPSNYDEFLRDSLNNVHHLWFRTAGICHTQTDSGIKIWVSHHYWKSEERQYFVRISSIEGSMFDLKNAEAGLKWETVFESTPGLGFFEESRHGNPFGGLQIGGRLVHLDDDHLLLTVGDHEFDGWTAEPSVPLDPAMDYGKILKINKESGESEHYTIGHRNPQGLLVGSDGVIWSTEHGPQGGDELNRIVAGENYGWPLVSLGTEYNQKVWPISDQQGRHDGFTYPVFNWTPSIGVSNLIEVRGSLFSMWQNNLLIASMEQESLYRAHVEQGRVVLVEPMSIGSRIRDIIETEDGKVFLWADDGSIIVLSPISAENLTGPMLFARCLACHTDDDSGRHSIGPNLTKLLGRPLAQAPGYVYSDALKDLGGIWDEDSLNAFLSNPQDFAPGTTMGLPGLPEDERNKIIDYIKSR
mgnify:CR=1 FL=1